MACLPHLPDLLVPIPVPAMTLMTEQHSTALHSTAQHCTALHSTALHSTAQHSTALHSTAQHSAVHLGTAQCSAIQHTAEHLTAKRIVASGLDGSYRVKMSNDIHAAQLYQGQQSQLLQRWRSRLLQHHSQQDSQHHSGKAHHVDIKCWSIHPQRCRTDMRQSQSKKRTYVMRSSFSICQALFFF